MAIYPEDRSDINRGIGEGDTRSPESPWKYLRLCVRRFKVHESNKAETAVITMTQASRMIIDTTK